jgi:hypothetical protein
MSSPHLRVPSPFRCLFPFLVPLAHFNALSQLGCPSPIWMPLAHLNAPPQFECPIPFWLLGAPSALEYPFPIWEPFPHSDAPPAVGCPFPIWAPLPRFCAPPPLGRACGLPPRPPWPPSPPRLPLLTFVEARSRVGGSRGSRIMRTRRGVSKGVEHGRRLPALWAEHPFQEAACRQGEQGLGMPRPSDTLESPWPVAIGHPLTCAPVANRWPVDGDFHDQGDNVKK